MHPKWRLIILNADTASSLSLDNQIIEEYNKTNSIALTAETCGCAKVTVRKVLITAGLWSSKTSRLVADLWEHGCSVKEIADQLCITEKAVNTYLPYTRGHYGERRSSDALKSSCYRERMNTAAGNMLCKSDAEMFAGDSAPDSNENNILTCENPAGQSVISNREGSIGTMNEAYQKPDSNSFEAHREERQRLLEQIALNKPFTDDNSWLAISGADSTPRVYHLRLELGASGYVGFGQFKDLESDLGKEESAHLFRLAKAETGITRDILVPSDMNLHALHYAIQQAFGWQNSHLHSFQLMEDDFNRLTAGRVGGYMDLCGILFRWSSEDTDDLCWDDDYAPEQSVKTWLRKKYSRPFRDFSVWDTRFIGKRYAQKFTADHPEITRDMRVMLQNIDFCCDLTENLLISDIFTERPCGAWSLPELQLWKNCTLTEAARRDALFSLQQALKREDYDLGSNLAWARIEDSFAANFSELTKWRTSQKIIEQRLWWDKSDGTTKNREYIRQETGMDAEDAYRYGEEQIRELTVACWPLFVSYSVHPQPFVNELLYNYDFGDDWKVKITLINSYPSGSEYEEIAKKGRPVCIDVDGLNLVDDVGGTSGYYRFLQAINGDDPIEKRENLEWARGLGWTGRRKKPENIL